IADSRSNAVRVVAAATRTIYGQAMTAGDIYTLAGTGAPHYSGDHGPATAAGLGNVSAVTTDSAGNLIAASNSTFRIRVIVAADDGTFYGQAMTAGDIYTVAGNGTYGYTGDGRRATEASMRNPDAVAVDADGNLLIADSFNNVIRVVATVNGTFYGQAMKAR